jgi:integrase
MKEVVTQSWNGKTLRLRFSYAQKRYTLTIPGRQQHNRKLVELITKQISSDILLDTLDESLERYKSMLLASQVIIPFRDNIAQKVINIPELYKTYLGTAGIDCDTSYHHFGTYQMLLRWSNMPGKVVLTLDMIPQFLIAEKISPSTFNKRKSHLKQFYEYLVRQGFVKYNTLAEIKSRKVSKSVPRNHKPFSEPEVVQILDAFKTDKFMNPNNGFRHSHYYLFVKFIFHTGVRVGEAAAVQVKDLNLTTWQCHIKSAWGAVTEGWKKKKLFKAPKSDKERFVTFSEELAKDLETYIIHKTIDDLLFIGPRGKVIDSNNFNDRIFFPILEQLKLAKRVIYAGRHTFVSLAVKQKADLPSLQYQLGHASINTTLNHYNENKEPPRLIIKLPTDKKQE